MRLLTIVIFVSLCVNTYSAFASVSVDSQNTIGRERKNSQCSDDEQVIFTCSIGKKIASVCASIDLDKTNGSLQYRFGKKGNPELKIPTTDATSRTLIRIARSPSSTANAAFIGIKNGKHMYYIFSSESVESVTDGMRKWVYKSGVLIKKKGKIIATLNCNDPAQTIRLDLLEKSFDVEINADDAWEISYPTMP